MTNRNQIYKCEICGNIVEVLHTGMGELVCCGQPMKLMKENTKDEIKEKHIPVIEKLTDSECQYKGNVLVKIGEIEHPMNREHYIEWIETTTIDNKKEKKFLSAEDKPKAEFCSEKEVLEARAYCNIHGLWKFTKR